MDISTKRELLQRESGLELKPFKPTNGDQTEQDSKKIHRKTRSPKSRSKSKSRKNRDSNSGFLSGDNTSALENLKMLMIYKMISSPKFQGKLRTEPAEYLQKDQDDQRVGQDGLKTDQIKTDNVLSETGQEAEREVISEQEGNLFVNPLNKKKFSPEYLKIKKDEMNSLPANQTNIQLKLIQLLDKYGLIFLQGETGSGKTTQIPRQVLRYLGWGRENKSKGVICTQPRQLNTEMISRHVAKQMDVPFDKGLKWVGYKHRDDSYYDNNTKLLYITDGTFLETILNEPTKLFDYGALIIDEVHERNVAIDLLLLYIKQAIHWQQNPDLGLASLGEELMTKLTKMKFILMSATLDLDTYTNYFKGYNYGILKIPGRTCRITVNNNHIITPRYESLRGDLWTRVNSQIGTVLTEIIETSPVNESICTAPDGQITEVEGDDDGGDVLVFLPSANKIRECLKYLQNEMMARVLDKIEFRMLYAGRSDLQEQVLKKTEDGKTKVVLSTNVAETGITIPGVSYVIDTGLKLESGYDHLNRMSTLTLNYVTKSEAEQRIGRAGRVRDGLAYRLYSNHALVGARDRPLPEIQRVDLAIWLMKLLELDEVQTLSKLKELVTEDLISPIDHLAFRRTTDHLTRLRVVEGDKLAFLGECLLNLGLDLEQAALLLLSKGGKGVVGSDIISILVAILNIGGSVIGKWIYDASLADNYQNGEGDLFGIYQLYNDWNNGRLSGVKGYNSGYLKKVKERSRRIRQKLNGLNKGCKIEPEFEKDADWKVNVTRMLLQIYGESGIIVKGGLVDSGLQADRYYLDKNRVKRIDNTLLNRMGDRLLVLEKQKLAQFIQMPEGAGELSVSWLINI